MLNVCKTSTPLVSGVKCGSSVETKGDNRKRVFLYRGYKGILSYFHNSSVNLIMSKQSLLEKKSRRERRSGRRRGGKRKELLLATILKPHWERLSQNRTDPRKQSHDVGPGDFAGALH